MNNKSTTRSRFTINWQIFVTAFLGTLVLVFANGCQTANTHEMQAIAAVKADQSPMVLKEGDSVKISFPGAPSLDTTATVRRDGKITLPNGGEMDVVGNTPTQLEKKLADYYKDKLISKEVIVSIQSSSFPVFVTGAVMKPGKIFSDHPLTVLEAVMEAGGFEYSKANLKKVKVVREKPAGNFTLDFKGFLGGRTVESFYLQPYDIIYVPEKFTWF
ncbi:MAG TPA: polysaccharide biosynthesis/export family protein [Verrucomicrobiae bacterium]|nr:polysaccharide biosynthesis/export family protein [Verrucomicrobiae bacterium]